MAAKTTRKPLVGLATVLFLIVSLNSTPSATSVPTEQPDLPSPAEIVALEELADWLAGSPDKGLTALSPQDLRATIRQRPRTFELFRRYNSEEANLEHLRALAYGDAIHAAAVRYGLDSLLVAAMVQVESSFVPGAVSPQGAVGLMQVMPATASRYGAAESLIEPRINLDVGCRYLRGLLGQFGGDLELALAAYNAGPGNVRRFGGVPPFSETRAYVARVLSVYVEHHRQVWESAGTSELLALR